MSGVKNEKEKKNSLVAKKKVRNINAMKEKERKKCIHERN